MRLNAPRHATLVLRRSHGGAHSSQRVLCVALRDAAAPAGGRCTRAPASLANGDEAQGAATGPSLTATYALRVTFTVAVTLRSAARRWPGAVFHMLPLVDMTIVAPPATLLVPQTFSTVPFFATDVPGHTGRWYMKYDGFAAPVAVSPPASRPPRWGRS